jgi:hypothetical protein
MAENDGDTPSRRKLMKLAATAAAAAPAGVVVGSAQGAGADAELIRLCSEYMEAVTAYDASGARLAPEDDPLWHAVEAIELRLDDLATGTLAGVVAQARAALSLARQPDGSEDFSTSYTGEWPERLVRDLLWLADYDQCHLLSGAAA